MEREKVVLSHFPALPNLGPAKDWNGPWWNLGPGLCHLLCLLHQPKICQNSVSSGPFFPSLLLAYPLHGAGDLGICEAGYTGFAHPRISLCKGNLGGKSQLHLQVSFPAAQCSWQGLRIEPTVLFLNVNVVVCPRFFFIFAQSAEPYFHFTIPSKAALH